jgi:streptogramin lyase
MRVRLVICLLPFLFVAPALRAGAVLLVREIDAYEILAFDETSAGPLFTYSDVSGHMAEGPDGSIYVTTGTTVARLDGLSGYGLETFASGGLTGLTGLRFAPDGHLYVASRDSLDVKRFDGTSGALLDSFPFPQAIDRPGDAIFGPDGHLYVSSTATDEVVRFDGASGAYLGVFATGGGLDGPTGLVFGPDGHLYVSSRQSARVVRYDGSTGALLDVFTTTPPSPMGLAFGPDGNLYVAIFTQDRVERFDASTGASLGSFASGGGLDGPTTVLFGPDGRLYVLSKNTHELLRFDATTGAFLDSFLSTDVLGANFDGGGDLTVLRSGLAERYDPASGAQLGSFPVPDLLGTLPSAFRSNAVVFGPGGDAYLTHLERAEIFQVDPVAGSTERLFAAGLLPSQPEYVEIGPDGLLYVSDGDFNFSTQRIMRLDPGTGAVVDAIGGGGLEKPAGIAFGSDGLLYAASAGTDEILRYDPADRHFLGVFASGGGLDEPGAIAFGGDGHLYVVSEETEEILRSDGSSGAFLASVASHPGLRCCSSMLETDLPGTVEGTSEIVELGLFQAWDPHALEVDSAGNVFVLGADTIRRIDPSGTQDYSWFDFPYPDYDPWGGSDLEIDRWDNLFVSVRRLSPIEEDAILRVDPSASETVLGELTYPGPLAVDLGGQVYVADQGGVSRITPAGVQTLVIGPDGDGQGNELGDVGAVSVVGGNLFVAGEDTDNVFRVQPDGTISLLMDGSCCHDGAALDQPSALATDTSGNVYVGSRATGDVFRIAPDGSIARVIDPAAYGPGTSSPTVLTLAVDSTRSLLVGGYRLLGPGMPNGGVVLRRTPTGQVTIALDFQGAGAGATAFGIWDIAFDSDDDVYLHAGERVLKLDRLPQCSDGVDNDKDGAFDWNGGPGGEPADAQCKGDPLRDKEKSGGGCGLGGELVLLVPLVRRLRSRRPAHPAH